MNEPALSFEDAFSRLEETVRALEQGGLTLEEAMALFEQGMKLAKVCEDQLNAAEIKFTQMQALLDTETLDD